MSAGTYPPGTGDRRNLGAEVQDFVNKTIAVARQLGDDAGADRLIAGAVAGSTTATIVIAGETKQGKSSLLNALVSTDGVSPVDADIATAVVIRVQYGEQASATLNLGNGERRHVSIDELPSWISLAHADLDRLRQVVDVDVFLPSRLLQPGVVLVDTPGVGGLVAGHATMTLASLETATAMVFVTDADTKLTRPELDFLAKASERIASVVFVLSKIDATPDWKSVLAENEEELRRHAPLLATAPFFPTSALVMSRSAGLMPTDKALAANLRTESGLPRLQSMIDTRIRPVASALTLANTVRLAQTTLDRATALNDLRKATATADPEVSARLVAEEQRLAEVRRDQQSWSNQLERELWQARNTLGDLITTTTDQVRDAATEMVRTARRGAERDLVARLDADLDAQAQTISTALRQTTQAICARLLLSLGIASSLELALPEATAGHVREFETATPTSMSRLNWGMAAMTGWGVVSRLTQLPGVGGTIMAAGAAIGLGSGVLGLALPLVGAVGIGYVVRNVRGGAAARGELQNFALAEINRAKADRTADVTRALTGAKFDIVDVVRAALQEREAEVATSLAAARAARDASKEQRLKALAESTRRSKSLDTLSRQSTALFDATTAAAVATAPNSTGIRRAGSS